MRTYSEMDSGTRIAYIALLIVLIPLSVTMWGWTATVLWKWFVVPIFDFPLLSIPQAIGLCSALSMFCGTTSQSIRQSIENPKTKSVTESLAGILILMLVPFVVLFTSWIVTWFL